MGCIEPPVELQVKTSATWRVFKAAAVPYAMEARVAEALEVLTQRGILEPIQSSRVAAPIVVVVKKSGKLRICGAFNLTVNKMTEMVIYPSPTIDQMYARLAGMRVFSKLDLAEAFHQIPVSEETSNLLVINTSRGLFRYRRLPFGVHAAPSLFQQRIEEITRDLDGVLAFFDDLLIGGRDETECMARTHQLCERLVKKGAKISLEKCEFFSKRVSYLGHTISAQGLSPESDKVACIVKAPAPKDVGQAKSFIGGILYYSRFIEGFARLCEPIYKLFKEDVPFLWTEEQQTAFEQLKNKLREAPVLMFYSPQLPLVLATDASDYGIGAVLSHETSEEKPIAYASRTLSVAEKNYSQIEKEGLSIVFGVRKFHQYVYGRRFCLWTDHKPLLAIFGDGDFPRRTSARLKRWAVFLMAYDFEIRFRSTKEHANADWLSRLPSESSEREEYVFLTRDSPVSNNELCQLSKKDKDLSQVRLAVRSGEWGTLDPAQFGGFLRRKDELCVEYGKELLLMGDRVVIPMALRTRILEELHRGHPGMVRMKGLARGYVWWPGIDKDCENFVAACSRCHENAATYAQVPIHPWEWPKRPWDRVHLDFAGPLHGRMWLVIVDAHSKYPEVASMGNATSAGVITAMRETMGRFGKPGVLVSDNGTPFTSSEFLSFVKKEGIHHQTVAPYNPRANGEAERFVRSLKQAIACRSVNGSTVEEELYDFLLSYRNTPHATTGVAPTALVFKYPCRINLGTLKTDVAETVEARRRQMVMDGKAIGRNFASGEAVWVRDFRTAATKWLPGIVASSTEGEIGQTELQVETRLGVLRRAPRHVLKRSAQEVENKPVLKEEGLGNEAVVPGTGTEESTTVISYQPDSVAIESEVDVGEPVPRNEDYLADRSGSDVKINDGTLLDQTNREVVTGGTVDKGETPETSPMVKGMPKPGYRTKTGRVIRPVMRY